MTAATAVHMVLALALAPLLPGIINRTKSLLAGRRGQPLLQSYYDLAKLLRKGAVYSTTTSWVFRAGPVMGMAAVLAALALTPFAGGHSAISFAGDILLFALLLGAVRYFLIAAALDTGSAFEGMGASREVMLSALAEPALVGAAVAAAVSAGVFSVEGLTGATTPETWVAASPVVLLAGASMVAVMLAETSRIPVDDPNTHLELTMIHEVMVLDHGGPDLAFILYTAALKMWLLGALVLGIFLPMAGMNVWVALGVSLAAMGLLSVAVGVVESVMARLSMKRLPLFAGGALVLALLALSLAFMGRAA